MIVMNLAVTCVVGTDVANCRDVNDEDFYCYVTNQGGSLHWVRAYDPISRIVYAPGFTGVLPEKAQASFGYALARGEWTLAKARAGVNWVSGETYTVVTSVGLEFTWS